MQDSQFSFAMEKEQPIAEVSNDDYEARLAEKEEKLKELEENRRKIVEFSKENTQPKEKTCTNPIDRNLELGKKLGIEGTPTLIFGNGLKMVGGRSAEDIRMIWKELGL
jgi:protein-disulfide isomerase